MIKYPFELSTTQQNHVGWLDVRQNDTGTQQFVATITTNDVTQDLTGLTAEFRTRQNGENVIIEKATIANAKNGVVEYVVSQYAMQQLGKNIGYFTFSKGDVEMFSTKDFCYYVNTSVTTFGLKGCDYIWRFEDLLEYVTGLANQSQVQLDKLKNDVTGIQKQIDDMFALIASQGVLSADEVRQLLINFMSGEDIEVTVMSDFNGKVEGSNIENANIFKRNSSPILQLPSSLSWTENTQAHYDAIKKTDGTVATFSYATEGAVAAGLISWNVLWILEKNFPSIFKNTITDAEKVEFVKRIITGKRSSVRGLGSGPSGNLLQAKELLANGTWGSLQSTNTTNQIREISTTFLDVNRITSDGKSHMLVNAEASDGTTASSISIDYANITLTVKLNISDFVATKAQYDALKSVVDDHVADTVKHITEEERTNWNSKQDAIEKTPWTTGTTAGVSHDGNKPLQYRKKGSKGQLRGGGMFPTDAGTTFLALPAFLWPPEGPSVYCEAIVRDSDYTRKCIIEIQPSGACKIITNTYSGNPCFFDRVEWDLD